MEGLIEDSVLKLALFTVLVTLRMESISPCHLGSAKNCAFYIQPVYACVRG